ncbi:MAG: DUF2807 domain-containing protein [Cytophagaceae bacterium]|jgi:hypothetical protein|nr:DUF2807 domain-containing protein [Cytophagaceae bacterium]
MKLIPFSTLLAAFILVSLSSCRKCGGGSREMESKTMERSGFKNIEAGGNFHVRIRKGDVYSVKITAQERILNDIVADQSGETLRFKLHWKHCHCDQPIEVEITMPELQGLDASGGASFSSEVFSGNRLALEASGGGKIEGNFRYSTIEAEISGGAKISLEGTAEDFNLNMSGGAKLQAFGLKTASLNADGSGGSKGEIEVSNQLKVRLSGGSKLAYKGNPSQRDVSTSGGAKLEAQ